jgi:hypothetical protein
VPAEAATTPIGMETAMDASVAGKIAYGRLLRLLQTGAVRGARQGKHWFCDVRDLRRWQNEQKTRCEPVSAA